MIAEEMGRRIRDCRVAAGISQVELGGGRYSGSYISHIESGRRKPTTEILDFMAERLGVGREQLGATRDADAVPLGAIEAMIAAQDHVYKYEWAAAARSAERAGDLAAGASLIERVWEARYLQAHAQLNDSQYLAAGQLWQRLAEMGPAQESAGLACQCLAYSSRAYRAHGDLQTAVAMADRALAITEDRVVDDGARVTALLAVISARAAAGQPERTTSAAAELRRRAPSLTGQSRGSVLWQLGALNLHLGQTELGLSELSQARDYLNPQVDLRAWGRLHRTLGHHQVLSGRLDEGRENLGTAAIVLRMAGNPGDLVDLRMSQAQLAWREGDLTTAESLVRHCLGDDLICGNASLLAEVEGLLSRILQEQGREADGREAARRAALAFEEAGLLRGAIAMWHRYADTASTQDGSVTRGLLDLP